MPHSSGGGSHGGGFHGGSGFHGSGTRGVNSNTRAYSHTYFPGAMRYVYYDRRHLPQVIYANRNPASWKPIPKVAYIAVAALWILISVVLILVGNRAPHKLSANYDTAIRITDGAGVFSDAEEAGLRTSLEAFREATGITPAVETVRHGDWQGHYINLETYAYQLYVTQFRDEKHWLIVYSVPAAFEDRFEDWRWEGMQGDDTDGIITESVADRFGSTLQKQLTARDRYTPGQAIALAFDSLTPDIMARRTDPEAVGMLAVATVFFIVVLVAMVWYDRTGRKYAGAVKAPENLERVSCAYCGSPYIAGTVANCPNCGAAVQAKSPTTDG